MLLMTHCKYKQANKLNILGNYQDCTLMMWDKMFFFPHPASEHLFYVFPCVVIFVVIFKLKAANI